MRNSSFSITCAYSGRMDAHSRPERIRIAPGRWLGKNAQNDQVEQIPPVAVRRRPLESVFTQPRPNSDLRPIQLPPDRPSRTGYPAVRSWLVEVRMQSDQLKRREFI